MLAANAGPVRASTIDPSFGSGGTAISQLGPGYEQTNLSEIVPQATGGFLATRETANAPPGQARSIRRYQENGSLDGSFAPQPAPPSSAEAIEEDGNILIAAPVENGNSGETDRLERLNADRTPDKTFGINGASDPVPFPIEKIAVLTSGAILVGGNETYGYGGGKLLARLTQVSVACFTAEGKLDTSYGAQGIVKLHTALSVEPNVLKTIVPRPDDGALLALDPSYGSSEKPALLVSLTPSGGLDSSFGESGKVQVNQSILGINLLGDGGVLVAGQTLEATGSSPKNDPESSFLLTRYTPQGDLDPSFADGTGEAAASFGGNLLAHAVLWGNDGSALIGGSVTAVTPNCVRFNFCFEEPVLARFEPDGRLDPSFGTGGLVRLASLGGRGPLTSGRGVLDLATRPVGGVLVGGGSGAVGFVTALTQSGAIDPSFGEDGAITERYPVYGSYQAGAITSDARGQLLVAGRTTAGSADIVPGGVLARYTSDGQLDPTFGSGDGYLPVPGWGSAISLAPGGSIFVLSGEEYSSITKVTPEGEFDTAFGEEGTVLLEQAEEPKVSARSIASIPSGGLIVAGSTSKYIMVAERVGRHGRLDRAFGDKGTVTLGFGMGSSCGARQVIVQPSGRILLAGCVGQDMALVRLLPNGALDKSFGHRGLVIAPVGQQAEATAVALHGGRILLTGWIRRSGKASYLLLRYTQAGRLDRSFGNAGVVKVEVPGKHIAGTEKAEILPTRRHIVVVRDGTGQPVLRFTSNGRFEPSFASGPDIAPGRIPATNVFPGPFGALQGNKPVLAWTTTLSPGLAVDLQRLRAG